MVAQNRALLLAAALAAALPAGGDAQLVVGQPGCVLPSSRIKPRSEVPLRSNEYRQDQRKLRHRRRTRDLARKARRRQRRR